MLLQVGAKSALAVALFVSQHSANWSSVHPPAAGVATTLHQMFVGY